MTADAWHAAASRIPLQVLAGTFTISHRVEGSGSWCTLLHGFPTSSLDWHHVWPDLTTRRRCLALDFLGFGDSDKPADHQYDLMEQADLAVALWEALGVTATDLVVHDYGVSVGQELLARHAEGRLPAAITSVTFLNGGIFPDLHRPQPAQLVLLDPEKGPELSAIITADMFMAGLRATYARDPGDDELRAQWDTIARRDGHRIGHRLIHYIHDRRRHAERWVAALETTMVPRHFVWGMLDPVSGAHMAARIAERMPAADLVRLDDVAHWPQIEAPDAVTRAFRRILA